MTIDIDSLTVGQLRALRAQIDGLLKPNAPKIQQAIPSGAHVLVRSHSSGVHVGLLVSHRGQQVVLRESRRIHRWRGANTLNEIAARGVDSAAKSGYTRVSEPTPNGIVLTEAIEVIAITDIAWQSVCSAGWAS